MVDVPMTRSPLETLLIGFPAIMSGEDDAAGGRTMEEPPKIMWSEATESGAPPGRVVEAPLEYVVPETTTPAALPSLAPPSPVLPLLPEIAPLPSPGVRLAGAREMVTPLAVIGGGGLGLFITTGL